MIYTPKYTSAFYIMGYIESERRSVFGYRLKEPERWVVQTAIANDENGTHIYKPIAYKGDTYSKWSPYEYNDRKWKKDNHDWVPVRKVSPKWVLTKFFVDLL